jgi:hypothetical protein
VVEAMSTIYFQPISNGGDKDGEQGRGADATWLRELRAMEADSEFIPPRVVVLSDLATAAAQDLESAAAKARKLHGEAAQTQIAAADADCEQGQVGAGIAEALLAKQF